MLIKFENNTIDDFDIEICDYLNDNHQCKVCIYDKQHRASFKSIKWHHNKSFELIHFDLYEINVVFLEDDKYILTFIDDCIRYDHVMLLSNKNASTILAAFKNYQAWIEWQSDH